MEGQLCFAGGVCGRRFGRGSFYSRRTWTKGELLLAADVDGCEEMRRSEKKRASSIGSGWEKAEEWRRRRVLTERKMENVRVYREEREL
ncbi:hypothetical protein SESBI_02889 [Sesbania bispinosa]|nr:hypothetical protein SESBI_02889 [Sesbania bispinosa]